MRRYLAAAAIAVYFCYAAWPGLLSGFSHDDLMNASFAFRDGWAKILVANVAFFSTYTRPLGALYYHAIYSLFGLHSLPFRIVGIGLIALNLVLLYRLARRLTGTAEAGLYAALLLAWHGNLAPLFYGSGNIYDVLAFTFYVGTLCFYAWARSRGPLRLRDLALLALLQIFALNSKEFSATIPLVLLAYEAIWHARDLRLSLSSVPWGVAVSAVISGVYAAGKVFGPQSLTGMSAYAPQLSMTAWLAAARTLLNDLLYQEHYATDASVIFFSLALVGIALLLRNRAALFGAAIVFLGPLPVMLIQPRGLASHYLTLGGLALWAGAVLTDLRMRFVDAVQASPSERRYTQAALFGLLLYWCLRTHLGEVSYQNNAHWQEARAIDQARRSLMAHPDWWNDGEHRILFVSDPFQEHDWASTFLVILASGKPGIQVDRLQNLNPRPAAADFDKYGLLLAWQGDQFATVRRETVQR